MVKLLPKEQPIKLRGKYAKNILKLQTGNIDPLLDYLRDDSLIEKVNEGEIILKPGNSSIGFRYY